MVSKDYELIVDMDENARRLELLHANVRKYETGPNTLAVAIGIEGCIRRKARVF